MGTQRRIELLIPGLFGPVPICPEDLPDTPALGQLLSRADSVSSPGRDDPISALLARFGIGAETDGDLPSAPFCRLADGNGPDTDGFVMHADPVHLRPDRDRLLLFDSRHLALTGNEADELVALFNGHFSGDGLRLEAPRPDAWYLYLDDPPRMHTTPLHAAVGRGINALLPQGQDARIWARCLNEAQMLFHHSEVNRNRENDGRLSVSGIWPWGGGRLPAQRPAAEYHRIHAGYPLAVGLASAAGISLESVPEDAHEMVAGGPDSSALVFWDELWPAVLDADAGCWLDRLRRLETWILPLLEGVKRAEIQCMEIDPCNGVRYQIGPWGMRRFWRRSHLLAKSVGRTPRG